MVFDSSNLLIIGVALLISILPLYISVRILGGKSSIIRVLIVNLLVFVAYFLILSYIPKYALIALVVATIFIYSKVFRMGLLRSLFAWIIQYVVLYVLSLLFGISLTGIFN